MNELAYLKNYVKKIYVQNDPSHDFAHIMRVYKNAEKICRNVFSLEQEQLAIFTLLEYRPELNVPDINPNLDLVSHYFMVCPFLIF